MKYLFLSIVFFFSFQLKSQNTECITADISGKYEAIYKKRITEINSLQLTDLRLPLTSVPIHIHRFTNSSGGANISITQIRAEIDSVNKLYLNAGIQLFECYPPQTIMVDSLYNYSINDEHIILNNYYTNGCINFYFHNTISAGSQGNVCGYSDYPPGQDYVFIAAGCGKNGSTLAHEVGHYFCVKNTHGPINGVYEKVDGSNCSTAGDFLCDTPADPSLSGKVNNSCIYTGGGIDQNNMPYAPNTSLIMSYSLFACRSAFSPMQYALINQTLINNRFYLNCPNTNILDNISENNISVQLFPNPANHFLTINISKNEPVEIKIIDIQNKEMYKTSGNSKELQLDVSTFKNGFYFVQFLFKDAILSKPLIITNN